MFTPLQKILPKTINAFGVKREIEAAIICEKYRKLAPRLVHTNALQHTFPKFYRRKILMIGVENPAWAAQIAAKKDALKKTLNESLGGQHISEIKTQVVETMPRP